MIINAPTALYKTVLPSEFESGNVTYTISNNDPPRSINETIIIPDAISKSIDIDRVATSRNQLGDRLFTISKSNATTVGSNVKQYEVGQVLEFLDDNSKDLQPMLVSDVEIRHDTNKLDYESIGMFDSEIFDLADVTYGTLLSELNGLVEDRKNVEIGLIENKKKQIELSKVIKALESLQTDDDTVSNTIEELKDKLLILTNLETDMINEANDLSFKSSAVLDRIRNISQVVR